MNQQSCHPGAEFDVALLPGETLDGFKKRLDDTGVQWHFSTRRREAGGFYICASIKESLMLMKLGLNRGEEPLF